MTALWRKLRPHIFSWHMLPCLAMLGVAIVFAITTGQASRVLAAVACMAMMMVMMSAIGGHRRGSQSVDLQGEADGAPEDAGAGGTLPAS